MKTFFRKFARTDWVTFILTIGLVLSTLLPIFFDVDSAGGWLRNLIISLAAATLSSIVIGQIENGSRDRVLSAELQVVQGALQRAIPVDAAYEVPAKAIGEELDEMLQSSSEWYFRGGSARWQRTAVLPRLAQIRDRPVTYRIQIISPFQVELCDKYASYRLKSRPNDLRANPKQIRLELLAFIFATAVWSSRSKIMPDIALLHRFSPFRLDGNSNSFMITVADIDKNGLRTNIGNWYHASLLDEFMFEAGNATTLTLPLGAVSFGTSHDVEVFFEELTKLNPLLPAAWRGAYDQSDWRTILDLAEVKDA